MGDGNNMANTWLQAADILGFTLHVSTPQWLRGRTPAMVNGGNSLACLTLQPARGLREGADLVTTDVWTSMASRRENEARAPLPTGASMPR